MVKLLFLLSLVYLAASIDFYVPLYTPVCLNYDWQKSTVIHGPYSVKDNQDWFRLTVTVLSSEGEQLFKKEGNSGILALTAHDGRHAVCFQGLPEGRALGNKARITLNLTENDWESKNEDLKLSTVEATLKQIEQRVAYLAVNFKVSKQRMAVLGEGINTTANRIPFFTACFVSTVIIFGLAQMFYLRAFFAKRKLI